MTESRSASCSSGSSSRSAWSSPSWPPRPPCSSAAGPAGRSGASRARRRTPVKIEVLARQTLGRGSSIAIVRAGERALVLGVTDQRVTLLAETTADELDRSKTGTTDGVARSTTSRSSVRHGRTSLEQLRERTVRRS